MGKLIEDRSLEQLWVSSEDDKQAVQKIFRRFGLEKKDNYTFRDIETGYYVDRPSGFFDSESIDLIVRDSNEKKIKIEDAPKSLQDKLILIQDFLESKLVRGKRGFAFDLVWKKRPAPKKSLEQRAAPYKEGRSEFKSIVPTDFFTDWKIAIDHDINTSDDYDEGEITYTYEDNVSVTFESRKDKERYVGFNVGLSGEARADCSYTRATYEYPEEWDIGDMRDAEVEEDGSLDVCDFGKSFDLDTEKDLVETLRSYVETYIENYCKDIEKYPESYFEN